MAKMLVATNPARRRKRRMSAKQRAAALRNLKKARSARKRTPTRRRSNPRRSPARKRRRASSTAVSAPRRRRRAPARRRVSRMRRRSNPARRRLIPRNLMRSTIQPALIGGTGAVVNDIGYNLLLGAIPAAVAPGIVDQFRTGYLRHAGKLASALLLTYAAGFVVNRRTAETLGVGAITVVGYNVARDVVMQVAPQLPLGAYVGRRRLGAYPGAGWQAKGTLPPMGSNYRRSGLAAYVRPRAPQLSGARSAGSFGVPPQLETANWYAGRRSAPEGYHEGQAA